jgi:hypothetical protein
MHATWLTSLAFGAALALGPAARAQGDGPLKLTLGYDGRLLFKVLDIEVQEEASSDVFSARSQLVSAGILAAIKHVHNNASSEGRVVAGEPQPGVFDERNLAGKTKRHVRAVWTGSDVAMTAEPAFSSLGEPPAARPQKLAATDPLTALVRMTIAGSREKTCSRSYLFFDGKQLYALDFGAPEDARPSDKETRLGLIGHFRCDVRFREVAGFGKKPEGKRNQGLQRPIKVDFAEAGDGGPWVISALHAQTPLGWASIELSRISVDGHVPEGWRAAQGESHGDAAGRGRD